VVAGALVACDIVQVNVSGGQAPYYIAAYEFNGPTTVEPLVSDNNGHWTYQVTQNPGGCALNKVNLLPRPKADVAASYTGSQLLLGLVDATGASGGVSSTHWSVNGQLTSYLSDSCLS
jgi:hypothetical protein